MPTEEITTLEELAFRAWPAAEVGELDGWRLRATSGVTRRANSAWTVSASGEMLLDERIARAERFYADRRLPAYFHVAPISQPAGLDRALEARGYVIDAPVSIQVVALRRLADGLEHDTLEYVVVDRYTPEWLHLSTQRGRFAAVKDVYCRILDRLVGRAGFALVRRGGVPVAIGLGVFDHPWAGFFNMLTVPEYRRQGAARLVLTALSRWAVARGASKGYLQVERVSTAATALYTAVGFEEAYGYHYRVPPK